MLTILLMFIINNRIINENIKMKSSILKSLINYIKHYRVINENNAIRFKCLLKIIIFKSDIYITSAFLYFCYNKHICYKIILLLLFNL